MYGVRLFIVVLQEEQYYCLHVCNISLYHSTNALHLQVSEIAKCIARGSLFLFYNNYVYCSLQYYICVYNKNIFISIGCCVSELHPLSKCMADVVFTRNTIIIILKGLP